MKRLATCAVAAIVAFSVLADDKNMAIELRKAILTMKKAPPAVIMDMPVNGAFVSVMASTEGEASLYFSTGGGMIGGGAHDNVRAAAIAFATETVKHKAEMQPTKDFPYPEADNVRFYLRTNDGVVFVDAPRSALIDKTHPLSPLFYRAQEVVTQFRKLKP